MTSILEKYANKLDLLTRAGMMDIGGTSNESFYRSKPDKVDKITQSYDVWSRNPNSANLNTLLTQTKPVMTSAMRSYAGGDNPILRGRAKQLSIKAIKSYKPSGDSSLRSWMMTQLQGLRRYSNQLSPLKVPERVQIDNSRIYNVSQEFAAAAGREPDDDELSEITGMSPKRIDYIRNYSRPIVAEGQYLTAEESGKTSFMPGVEDNSWEGIWSEFVYNDLDPINKRIFDMRLGRGKHKGKTYSVSEISRALGISAPAISQRSNKIADKLAAGESMKGAL